MFAEAHVTSNLLSTGAELAPAFLLEVDRFPWSFVDMSEDPRRPEDVAMDRYAAGDEAALAIVYDALCPRLYGFLLKRTRNDALAEDLLQQTFLQIHRARGTFAAGAAVAPWAFSIARRLMIDAARKRGRARKHFAETSTDDAPDLPDIEGDVEQQALARELGARASALLDTLPKNQQQAFLLVRVEGLSLAEAAEMLGTTVSAIKLRAHRAYKALEEALGAEFGRRFGREGASASEQEEP
jgi:RNA polymerase sigma-70 factor (ECF subfamily)